MAKPKYCYNCKQLVLIADSAQPSWRGYCCDRRQCFYDARYYLEFEALDEGFDCRIIAKKNGFIFCFVTGEAISDDGEA